MSDFKSLTDRFRWVTGEAEPPTYVRLLGVELRSIGNGECVLQWTPSPSLLNSANIVQGGFIAAVLDLASGLATIEPQADNSATVSLKLDIEFFRAIKADGHLTYNVTGNLVHRSRRWVTSDAVICNQEKVFARTRHLMTLPG